MPRWKSAWKPFAIATAAFLLAVALARYWTKNYVVDPRIGRPTETVLRFEASPPPLPIETAPEREVRNLILLIGDGMGFGQVAAARAALVGMNGRLEIERMPVASYLTTHSADRLLTDSAAGATALATGRKTDVLRVGTAPDGSSLMNLMEAAQAQGKSVGLVTDSYLWDATPASFTAHLETRGDLEGVALGMASSGFELFFGEEHVKFEAEGEVLDAFRARGFRIVRDGADLGSPDDAGPVLGLFPPGTIHGAETAPQLHELAAYAIEALSHNEEGFVLLIETEETDTASHRHEFERMVAGMAALDRAAKAAFDFARRDPLTLVLVTADHDTGGLALLGGRDGEALHVRWSSRHHTGNPVPLFAQGPGAELVGRARDNTEVPRILSRILGLDLDRAPL